MYVKHKTPNGHGGVPAIFHQFVPVCVTQLGHIAAKSLEKLQRMLGRKILSRENVAKFCRFGRKIGLAMQRAPHVFEQMQFLCWLGTRMVGYVVSRARKSVEGKNDRAIPLADQKGCDGEIFVAMPFARRE